MQKYTAYQPRAEVAQALDFVANNDIKAMSYVALEINGESTRNDLGEAMTEHTGILACKEIVRAYPITFSDAGFADVAVKDGRNHKPARFFTTTRADVALPTVGTLLEWADIHEQSLTTVFSGTPSKGSHGPSNTVQLLDVLSQGHNIGDAHFPGYKLTKQGWSTAFNKRLQRLVEDGYIFYMDEPVRFKILNPKQSSRSVARGTTISNAVWRVLGTAKDSRSDHEWTRDELVALALQEKIITEDMVKKLADNLMRAVSIVTPSYFIGAVEKRKVAKRQYAITKDFEAPAADLLERICTINSARPEATRIAAEYALAAYRDPKHAAQVIERGIAASPYVRNKY